ncbi:MAG: hypothetical protein ABI551_26095 [Polyangiaceae bacterium]
MVDWEDAFIGMCTLLKEPAGALANASARPLSKHLADPDRQKRARVLADVLAQIAHAIDHVELTEVE